jgi:DNA-binding NarL/FixJ family response regulator
VKPRPRRKSVVIIDDHIFLRQGLERVLNATDEFFVCEEAGNAADGLDAVREMRPDAVIVDVGLPDISGIELTKQLVSEFPGVIVLVLSMHEEAEYAVRAMQAGARGYHHEKRSGRYAAKRASGCIRRKAPFQYHCPGRNSLRSTITLPCHGTDACLRPFLKKLKLRPDAN